MVRCLGHPKTKVMSRTIRETRSISKVCAKARMTVSIIVTTPRRETSKKMKIKKLTSQATSKVTGAINIDKRLGLLRRALMARGVNPISLRG